MIFGKVRDLSPHMVLALPGLRGSFDVEFVVDTGFEGELAISAFLARQLEADYLEERPIALADGPERNADVYIVELEWHDGTRETEVMVLEGNPLIGMFLLEGSELRVEAVEGGEVVIQEL